MKTALQIGITAILVGALAFYGGVTYGRMSGGRSVANRFAQGGAGGAQGGWNGNGGTGGQNADGARVMRGGFAGGEIISSDSKSITVKMADGSTRTVYFDTNTRIARSSEATTSDLAKGSTVIVTGQAGSDGSVTARSIQIVPAGTDLNTFMGGGRGFGGQGAPQGGQQGQPPVTQ